MEEQPGTDEQHRQNEESEPEIVGFHLDNSFNTFDLEPAELDEDNTSRIKCLTQVLTVRNMVVQKINR
jgi:hypothetical protein